METEDIDYFIKCLLEDRKKSISALKIVEAAYNEEKEKAFAYQKELDHYLNKFAELMDEKVVSAKEFKKRKALVMAARMQLHQHRSTLYKMQDTLDYYNQKIAEIEESIKKYEQKKWEAEQRGVVVEFPSKNPEKPDSSTE